MAIFRDEFLEYRIAIFFTNKIAPSTVEKQKQFEPLESLERGDTN